MLDTIQRLKSEGKKIGYTCSAFDMCHAGHIAMLAEAKSMCDYLIVGLLTDPTISRPTTKEKPIQSVFERWVQVQALEYVDLIIPFETEQDIVDQLLVLQPDIRFCGEEYKGKAHTGSDLPIKIHYNQRKHSFSSTELKQRYIDTVINKKLI